MRHLDGVICGFLIVFSVVICWASGRLGIGTFQKPGPGFLPFLCSSILALLAIVMLIRDFATLRYEKGRKVFFSKGSFRRQLLVVAALVCYSLLLRIVGFLITSSLLIAILLLAFDWDLKRWWRYLIFGSLVSSACFLLFSKWLQVQLPVGTFG